MEVKENEVKMEILKTQIHNLSVEQLEDFLAQLESKDMEGFKGETVTLRIAFSIFFSRVRDGSGWTAVY